MISPAAYVLSAGAVLAGAIASAEPAEAEIIYTSTYKSLTCSGMCIYGVSFGLNLNHGKKPDFRLIWYAGEWGDDWGWQLSVAQAKNTKNEVWSTNGRFAAALSSGAVIKAARNFRPRRRPLLMARVLSVTEYGPWVYVQNRYLGLKFFINGKVHYGWARLNVQGVAKTFLTGYAYETIPNKPIIAGKTHGEDEDEPATLGRLAAGRK